MLRSKLFNIFSFFPVLMLFFPGGWLYAQEIDPVNWEICEGDPVTVEPGFDQAGSDANYTWYHDAGGTVAITDGTYNGIEYQLGSDGELTILGLKYEPTASTYIQASTYNYYVELSGSNVPPTPLKHIKVRVFHVPRLRTNNPPAVCDPDGSVDLSSSIDEFDLDVYDYQLVSPSGNAVSIDDIYDQQENGTYTVRSSFKEFECWSEWKSIDVTIALSTLEPAFDYEANLGTGNVLRNGTAQLLHPVDFFDVTPWAVSSWHWDFGDGHEATIQNPTHTFAAKGIYTVVLTAEDTIGCLHTLERLIEVRDDYLILIPNAFSPSGQKNNHFKPEYKGVVKIEFYVFNTWGELLFFTQSLDSEGWNGTWKGKVAPEGNYIYKGVFITSSGMEVIKDGVFSLIR
ncbi:gliding motility-associated C-terminal domain-containing protein [Algoriphagus locisalis]|uniref:Gliding motility-associated C-terminal domain-containing protein n=1 Tax=Algoriphagus locisalis TaxID=305507 RepID=A0A1I7ATG8_9BACT|nr:PKD domain-containing protein [Algoriphagus locisalis]SFT78178.1 gliding motility-associated C-terminal domain-containing protein [Algoriphagus locisalis]